MVLKAGLVKRVASRFIQYRVYSRSLAKGLNMDLPALYLKPNEDKRLRAGHLWVFSNEVDSKRCRLPDFAPGQLAQILAQDGKFLGTGYVNPNSLICARLLSRDPDHLPGRSLFIHRLKIALSLREHFYAQPFYRLVFGEADGLPGLVVDRYNDVLVAQITTAGMECLKDEIVAALEKVIKPRGILFRSDSPMRQLEGIPTSIEEIGTVPDEVLLTEGECSFRAPLKQGQKTGWFFDQHDNRTALAPYVKGGQVLDVFSYLGAWGIQAARAGATKVSCVESSATAGEILVDNASRNGFDVELISEDAFTALPRLREEGRHFDTIIVDPPAFIKRRKDIGAGSKAYRRINQLALTLVEPGGFLITGSCSYHMSADSFVQNVQAAARHVDRNLQLLECAGQGRDHPIHPAIPETAYLKMFYFRVLKN